jgi:outer membrane protein OmpA-like peptidoglycan-associated protein
MNLSKFSKHIIIALLLCAGIFANNINSGGQLGVVRSMSSYTLGLTGINIGGALKYDRDFRYVTGPGGTRKVINTATGLAVEDRKSPHIFSGNIYIAYGLFRCFDLSLDLPLYYDVTGWDVDRAGVGDFELAAKFAHPSMKDNAPFTNAYYLKVTFPTGQKDRGYFPRHSYYQTNDGTRPGENQYTSNEVLFNPMLIWTLNFDRVGKGFPLLIHGNIGAAVTQVKNSSAIIGNLAFELSPVEVFTIFVELSGEARAKYYTKNFKFEYFVKDPFIITPGARLNFPIGMYITVAGDLGLSSKKTEYTRTWDRSIYRYATTPIPKYGAQLTLGWSGVIKKPDTDRDGFTDKEDRCPNEPEDRDGFEDGDGCPDLDNDGDGIPDLVDKCPNDKADCDGCPVLDKDNDGILDDKDKCPNNPEDMDNFEDDDGCPEADNDNDGLPDEQDACPFKAEDADGFEDLDGCPDVDNDGDGVLDEDDDCPTVMGSAENKGCPMTKEIQREKLILTGVNFQSGKAILTEMSYKILDNVYESLAEWTNVTLEIQGHTDSQGSVEYNQNLSQERADAVKFYLVQKGIESNRLTAVGYGEDNPISDNSTAAGREKNRRVELNRTD